MQSIEEIYKENFNLVHKYLFCLTRDLNISEDLTQETFYKAIENIDKFKGECKLSTWLCQIAKNLWFNELKKKKFKDVQYDENLNLIEISEGPEEQTISNDNKNRLYENLNLFKNYRRT